jgi:hypothetical protein
VKRHAIAAGVVIVLCARSAFPQSAVEDVHIEYRAPATCPSEAWVLGRISGRTDRFRQVAVESASRGFVIQIDAVGSSFAGTLEITEREPEPRSTSRRIEGPRCEDVADGLALIAALTIDPRAKLEAVNEKPPQVAPPKPEKPPPPPPPPPPPKMPPPRPSTVPYFELGAGFAGVNGVGPAFLYGVEVFAEGGWLAEHRWFSPGFRLTGRHARHDDVAFDQGSVFFRLTALAVDVCPLRAPIPTVGIRLCANGEFGWLDAEGAGVPDTQQSSRGWAALGGALRISAAMNRIGLEAAIGGEAPLRRDRFFFFESEVGDVNPVVVYVGLAITGRIY